MLPLLLASSLAVVTNTDVQMKLAAVKSNILVGEFTKLRLHWTALKPIEIMLDSETVLIDDGTGFRPHAEAHLREGSVVATPTALRPGGEALTEYSIGLTGVDPPEGLSGFDALGASLRPVFSRPGKYRVKVQYDQAQSNEVEIEAIAPTAREAELLQQLYRQPILLTWMVGAEKAFYELADSLIEKYGSHPYLARTIFERTDGTDRDDFERLRAMDFSRSAFADEHLLLVAERGGNFMGKEFERETLQDVIEKFPGSLAARKAEDLLKRFDQDPPTLAVTTTPSSLWPPNHKMVSVSVAVNVTDEKDPSPSVKLVSVTCDDGCNPAKDIAGAALDTDDRAFELRSERQGFGQGRTYTITYEAVDAGGNKSTATTAVTVPHDQGVAKRK